MIVESMMQRRVKGAVELASTVTAWSSVVFGAGV
jgi:hypothetical protein